MPFKKGHRIRSKRSMGSVRTATPTKRRHDSDDEDDTVKEEDDIDPLQQDFDASTPAQDALTPAQDEVEDGDEGNEEVDDDDGDSTIQARSRGQPRKRGRFGRRSTARGDDTPDPGDDDASEVGTPRRKRGRASAGVTRPRGRKRAQADAPQVIVNGEVIDVINDEALVDDDPEGNEKVDENGNLQGGREYRVRTFKIIDRGDRLYMLSTEPARCCGFRDSYLFFAKHPKLHKILLTEPEKLDLIGRDILPNSYKGRNIGVVTARSVFREFGARIIVGGRRITDDYKVTAAREEGVEEGALADPEDRVPGGHEGYNRNRYVAWFGASDVYRTQANTQGQDKKGMAIKRRNNVTVANWQALHAKEASRFNSGLVRVRRTTHTGVYDPNTNSMLYPSTTQPTHARWEQVPTQAPQTNGHLTNGVHEEDKPSTIFKPVPAIISRNFTVVDAEFTAPPLSNIGYPGPDGVVADFTAGTTGLSSIPADILDDLPEDCRLAFEEARTAELRWKEQWSTEQHSALRGDLKVGFLGYPV